MLSCRQGAWEGDVVGMSSKGFEASILPETAPVAMGGDHKCPVCEATFTRPQHVARHMRSHTGDRPYKCQYCGDQFARSDLLSRHVNKCHANEKPVPTTGVRRKGSASASRATTSKQVCDQCVQANTSCDGSNPCAKCIQRKYRCTFVKFHRQTAPVGPGHVVRPVHDTSSGSPSPTIAAPLPSSRVPMYQQNPDEDFILSPPPPTVVPNTMADALYGTSFTFPPLYPTTGDNTDYVGKYRAHTELFESAGHTGAGPTLYDSRSSSSWLGWGQQDPTNPYHHHQQDPAPSSSLSPIMNDRDMRLAHHQQQRSNMNPNHYVNVSIHYPASTSSNYDIDNNGALLVPDQRPLPSHPDSTFQSKQLPFSTHDQNAFSSHPHLHQHHHQHHLQQHIVSDLGRPEFSSAFGLLSLDPMADGPPFFDDPNQAHNQALSTTSGQLDGSANMDTPMPRRGSGQLQLPPERFPISASSDTPSRDKDSKELKEFWKQYMRLPLSGSGMFSSAAGSEGVTPNGNTSKTGSGPGYRRARVASLPAVKTPIVDGGLSNHSNFGYSNSTLNFADGNEEGPTGGGARRPPVGVKEDLRSYEAAVMARKAPTTLNLKLKRPMRRGNDGGGQLNDDSSSSEENSPPRAMGGDITQCSSSSSLANVFGAVSHSRDQTVPPGFQFSMNAVEKEEGSSPALSSRASSDDGRSDVVCGLEVVSSSLMGGRPSFKRLPSQTLGPDNSKRAFYGFGEEEEDDAGVVCGWDAVDRDGVAERMRRRRMSEPSTGLTTGFYRGEERSEE